jgi:hypothetical protein
MSVLRLAQPHRRRHGPRPGRARLPACALAAIVLIAGCAPSADDPRAAIEALIAQGVRAAEEGDHAALAALLAPDYEDADGRDRRQAALYLRVLLRRYRNPEISVRAVDVELISPVLAVADVTLVALGRRQGASVPLGFEADRLGLRLALRRDDADWRVTRGERIRAASD